MKRVERLAPGPPHEEEPAANARIQHPQDRHQPGGDRELKQGKPAKARQLQLPVWYRVTSSDCKRGTLSRQAGSAWEPRRTSWFPASSSKGGWRRQAIRRGAAPP